ncbi:outer membrane lipoprotein carrier protein LolA [Microvirga sp. ACRRW]|uniref:LolA family protein n=1 Tax=Microvirga sp. ACRRW TaxID=2918205 RepID=UPI001EF43A14|nr:outer-membrane lipoprotein carrier protein LolA [Microvirga sp. ACRRW]MCG7392667.1 outer membrane lipoprotein carrier protein LolA [Microvirga sp. ACRRW]
MLKKSLRRVFGLVLLLAFASPVAAQQRASDPLTRFLDGIFKPNQGQGAPEAQPQPAQPAPAPAAPEAAAQAPEPAKPAAKPKTAAPKPKPTVQQQAAKPKPQPEAQPAPQPVAAPAPKPAPAEPEVKQAEPAPAPQPAPVKVAEPPKPARSTPAQAVPTPTPLAAATAAATPVSPPNPSSPAAALERVNAYFNAMDQMSAYFVQKNPNGQQVEGTLSVRRPGQLHFAYAPPSTLEIVSDGRNVAIRDKRLGTNDVYPVSQTPLKFLVQENVNLARDTKVKDVQIARDGMITVSFDDSATLGGTSKITLRFDSRANALKQWTVVDSQGYETTVVLSGLNVTQRKNANAAN